MIDKVMPSIAEAIKQRNPEPKKAGRPKGAKMKSTANMTPAKTEKFIKKRAETSKKAMQSVKLKDDDYKYLLQSFMVLKDSYNQAEILDKHPKGQKGRRYTPRQMYDNASNYIESTIRAAQPLTITGMGLFMGMHRKQIFNMLNQQKGIKENPAYDFIYDFCDFIEMYNEYAAHKKQNPAGPIFILKNFGWKDKFEIEASRTEGALTDDEREAAQKRISQFSE